MSDLLKSALGFLNNPSSGGPGGPQGGPQSHYGGGGVPGGMGSNDETSAVGEVIAFQCIDQQKRNVKVLKLIAEGGFSYVYRGVDTSANQLVAVKKMLAPDPEALKGIEQEVEFMRQFQHDNIIKFYGSIIRPSGRLKEYLIAMEYCKVPLPTPPLRLQHTTQVFGQTCKAIKYLHDFGIVHRDIKLENVLIGSDGLVKLVDFGSATMEKIYPTQDWSMSKRTIIEEQIAQKTTPMYRAPEMLDLWSNHPIDEHSDLWALGCLLFALNFGQHPFQDSNKLAIVNANYNLPKNVSDSNPIICVIRGLLKVNPLERLSFGQIFELLQSIAECENFAISAPLPFKPAISPEVPPAGASLGHPTSAAVGNGSGPHRPQPPPSSQHHGGGGGSGLLGSIKGMGSSLLKNIKEQSQQYMYGPAMAPSSGPQPGGGASVPPPSRPPPPAHGQGPQRPPPARPAPPSPRSQPKSAGQHLEFENREYDLMQQRQQHAGPPSRPAPPKPPPPSRPAPPPEPVQETVGNLLDISLDSSVNAPPTAASTQPQTNSNLLDDLFGSTTSAAPQTTPSFADELLWGSATPATTAAAPPPVANKSTRGEVNLLGDTSDPFASLLGKSAPTTTTTSPNPTFGAQPPFGGPTILQSGMSGMPTSSSFQNLNFPKNAPQPQPQQTLGAGMDPFGSVGKSASSGSIPKNSSTPNLLSDQILDDIIGLNIAGGTAKPSIPPQPTAATGNNGNKSNPSINLFGGSVGNGNGSRPNYNRHQIFDATSPTNAPEKKATLNDAFGDILSSQGFASSKGGGQPRTMNDLRKIDMLQNQNIDPVQLKVNEWREGKKKNIRALLASLHTVTWEGCNWEETNMSQMITPAQVKKIYRKACLAIHPDKQMGQEWEQLAKLLFVELNEAWAAFEETQQM